MRRFLPFAALLGVAFVLGCQDVGTGPDGLVPQFDRPVTNNTNCDPPVDGHCHDDAEPPTGDGPHIAVCCSQKEIGRSAARDIASELNGSYSTLKAKRFNEMSPAELAATYDVLIFYWKTSDNVNADWTRLLEYMAAGGGIIYEDPTNLADLAAGVSILGVQGHATERNPIFITIEHESGLTTAPNGFTEGEGTEADSTFINNHFIFDLGNSDDALFSFLTLTNNTDTWPNGEGAVVGLYGEFSPGRIVLTGLDNDYHGGNNVSSDEQRNHYNLLKNEIVWVGRL